MNKPYPGVSWWCEENLLESFVWTIDDAKARGDLYHLISETKPVYTPAQQKRAREVYRKAREAGKSHRTALDAAKAALNVGSRKKPSTGKRK